MGKRPAATGGARADGGSGSATPATAKRSPKEFVGRITVSLGGELVKSTPSLRSVVKHAIATMFGAAWLDAWSVVVQKLDVDTGVAELVVKSKGRALPSQVLGALALVSEYQGKACRVRVVEETRARTREGETRGFSGDVVYLSME